MTVRILVLLICVLLFTTLSLAKDKSKRDFQKMSNDTLLGEEMNDVDDEDEEEVGIQCRWKWSKWNPCSKPCNTGNTTRRGLCICDGFDIPFPDSECSNVPNPLGVENVPCNEHICGEPAACNKLCWMSVLARTSKTENITDGIFECPLGCSNQTCPKGKSYSQILFGSVPPLADNAEWYYLAKEWYAAILNVAAGVNFSSMAIQAIDQAGNILENCAGWGPDDMKMLTMVYAVKEKLNRANNEIGGLDQVDEEVAEMMGGGMGESDDEESSQKSLIGLAIGIPMGVIAIIAVVIMISVYYVRRKSYVVVVPNEPHPESSLDKADEVPLQDQQKGEDSSSEEKI